MNIRSYIAASCLGLVCTHDHYIRASVANFERLPDAQKINYSYGSEIEANKGYELTFKMRGHRYNLDANLSLDEMMKNTVGSVLSKKGYEMGDFGAVDDRLELTHF